MSRLNSYERSLERSRLSATRSDRPRVFSLCGLEWDLLGDVFVACDINPRAVAHTAANAERHGVAGRLRAVHGDLFCGLAGGDRFDVVFWSSNYVLGPDSYEYRFVHERAYVDPGYRARRRYLQQVPHRITPGGRALLHFSDRGDLVQLHRIAGECGRRLRVLGSCRVREGEYGDDGVEHMLIRIEQAGN